jgi:hypothetical protein
MEKVQVKIEESSSRGLFSRPLVLVALSAVLVTGVLAIIFQTEGSVEFGQSITAVQACGYNNNTTTLTPSSAYNANSASQFALTGLKIVFTGSGCTDQVLSTSFILQSTGAPATLKTVGSDALTNIEVINSGASSGVNADLVSAGDVALCTTDGTVCYTASSADISVSNSNGAETVQLGLASLPDVIDAGDVNNIVLQTFGGFTSTPQ